MDPLATRVRTHIQHHGLLPKDRSAVVGLSGGVDSIVLTYILRQLGVGLTAVHVNYQLRGDASDEDEAFVRSWCEERDVDLVVRTVDARAEADERGKSIQQAARALRYQAFEEVARSASRSVVALGHHRDDQAETLLLHLFRGTGIEGLAGMPVRRPIRTGTDIDVVRPLLFARRAEIEAYAAAQGLSWRNDASNTESKYRRGALRTDVIPVLEEVFGDTVVENIARASDLVRAYVDEVLGDELAEAFDAALGERAVDLAALSGYEPVIRHRILLEAARRWLPETEIDAAFTAELDELASLQTGRRLERAGRTIWKERGRLFFEDPDAPDRTARDLAQGGELRLPSGTFTHDILSSPPDDPTSGAPLQVFLDARHARPPLSVRLWRAGDRFIPLGMNGEKKVSDFLTDERVPPHQRKHVLVVESEGRIVWVVPYRPAESARIRDDTVQTVRLRFRPDENTHPDRS